MKLLKKAFLGLIILVVLIVLIVRFTFHESRPTILEGDAEVMANKMLSAVDKAAWDSLLFVKWTFPGEHQYVWDRINNNALVSWDDYVVHLNMDEVDGIAFKSDIQLSDKKKNKAIQKAWSNWCNDSFWFSAPYKIFDIGTTRQLAKDEDGNEGLLISYASGGVTPGDQYLWFMDDNGLPTAFKMWVKIIPIGGVYASWENYEMLSGGAKVATEHTLNLGNMKIGMTDIASGNSWQELGYTTNPIQL